MSTHRRLVVTPTDVELFRWLWILRVLTLGQLRRLGYYQIETGRLSALDNVRKRLHRLWKKDYLIGDTLLDTRERIYFLGERALGPLRDHYGIEQRHLYKYRNLETVRQLHHALLVSECAVRIVESVRSSTAQLVDLAPLGMPFYHTHTVEDPSRRKHINRFVSQEDISVPGQPRPHRVRPDLVFALARGAAARLYFVEADRGSESPMELARKQLAYHFYSRARDPHKPAQFRWQRYGFARDFRVLVVTTHPKRIVSLRRTLSDKRGFSLMAFTTEAELKLQSAVWESTWIVPDGSKRALLKEPASSSQKEPRDV